ncbi:MAG: hypothetical protein ACOX40_06590 [Bacilli bacterium]
MKKIISIITILFATFALYSCFSVTDSLEITSIPKLEFNQNENFPLEDFVKGLKLRVNGGQVFSASTATTSVSGFDLSQAPGVYTATVSYAAGGVSASATFMYTIRPAKETYGFADYIQVGDIHTYTISNVNHFRNIVLNHTYPGYGKPSTYFILSNDLDFENTSPWIGYEDEILEFRFTGTFDGNNKTIKNLHSTESIIFNTATAAPSTTALFHVIESATFKNITFDNCIIGNEETKGIGLLGFGLSEADTALAEKETSLIMNNITINSNCKVIGSANAYGLVAYAPYETITCSNYTFNGQVIVSSDGAGSVSNIRMATSDGANQTQKVEFTNCNIGGVIQASGTQSSAFITNQFPKQELKFVNCNISATIYNSYTGTDSKFAWFASSNTDFPTDLTITISSSTVTGNYYIVEGNSTSVYAVAGRSSSFDSNYVNNGTIIRKIKTSTLSFDDHSLILPQVTDAKYYVVTVFTSFQLFKDGSTVKGSSGKVGIEAWKFTENERATTNIERLLTFSITDDLSEVGWGENNYVAYHTNTGLNGRIFYEPSNNVVNYKLIAYNSLGVPIAVYTYDNLSVTKQQQQQG